MSLMMIGASAWRQGGGGGGFFGAVMALSPWGYWRLDDPEPISLWSAADSSGNGRNGNYASGTSLEQPPLFSGSVHSVHLSGSQRISLPGYPVLAEGQRKLTLLACIKASSTSIRSILSADSSGNRSWQFRLNDGNLEVVTFSPSTVTTVATASLNDGEPHMVAAVFDDSLVGAQGSVKVYIDGGLAGASTVGTPAILASSTANVAIGSRSSATTQEGFIGNVDECAMFSSALTPVQIAELWGKRNG